MGALANVDDLVQGYGRREVITQLSFELGPGTFGLLGPNGAGKTTLLRTLATVTPPWSGTLRILGEEINSERTAMRARRDIGYLPQDFGFPPTYTVEDFVRYSAWLRGVPSSRARAASRDAICAVGLSTRATIKMKALSGGMLQRAGIAAAIVGRPSLLLLDEPTVGLDPAQRLEFRGLLRSLDDVAVVLSTHLVEDIAAVCDGVAVMDGGRFLFNDRPARLAEIATADAVGDTPLERGYMTVLHKASGNGTLPR